MKNFFIYTVFCALFAVVSSCSNDDNGNASPNPCAGTNCQNGAPCVNGVCQCPTGYTGPNCAEQIKPSHIKMTNIKVTRYPETRPDGSAWSQFGGTHVTKKLFKEENGVSTLHWETTAYCFDITPTTNCSGSTNFDLFEVENTYHMKLYADTGFQDEEMGSVSFKFFTGAGGFPTTLVLDNGGNVAFEVTVTYFFQ